MNKSEARLLIIGLIIVFPLSLLLARSVIGTRVDNIIRDRTTDDRQRNEITVIGIDDASLQTIGAWPWKRDIFAKLIDTLYKKGARLVVFDVLFLEERDGDEEVKKILAQDTIPVVFAAKFDEKGTLLDSVYAGNPHTYLGIAHVYPDEDGKVRTVPLSQKDADTKCYSSLAYEAFSVYTNNETPTCNTNNTTFLYQPKLPTTISLIDVLNNTAKDDDLRGKVIFVGSNSLDIEDHFVGQNGEKVAGVYVHASIFSTLLNNSFLKPITWPWYVLILAIFLLHALILSLKVKRAIVQGFFVLCGTILIVGLVFFMMSFNYEISLATILFPYLFVSLYSIMHRYTITEKKNNYIKELFGQYVHPKVLLNILTANTLKLGGERKYITILFSDIRGFTTMTEMMQAEELVETLNTYLETMSPIIMEREGVIDKYIGDAIMAFWNAPVPVTNHEEKAVRASLAMTEALKTLKTVTPLAIGIGLHAGEAIVGNIGSKARINYTIIGDAVNACSRLEGLTKKYGLQIIVSNQIKSVIHADDIQWRSIDRVRVKGKTEVMELYEPIFTRDANMTTLEANEKAFSAYSAGNFEEALHIYKKTGDTYSTMMQKRIEDLLKNPPAEWTGVWDWDEK